MSTPLNGTVGRDNVRFLIVACWIGLNAFSLIFLSFIG